MAHNIAMNTATGKNMCYTAGELPWHHLGQNVAEAQTWEKAIELAQLDWKVVEAPLYTNWSQSGQVKVEGYKAIVRADTKQTLGIHGLGYKPFQNADAFKFCDALLEEGALYESAGGLGNGERIWCLARIPQADFEIGQGDKHQMYLLVATSHDGSLSTTITCTDVRVVCQNTMTAALGMKNESADGKLKIKHTRSADEKLTRAQQMIQGTVMTASSLKSKLQQLAQRQLRKESVQEILGRLFPVKAEALQTKRENIVRDVLNLFEANDGNAFQEQRGTAYNLLNAVTNYTDHVRASKANGHTAEYKRAESAVFGSGAALKTKALEVIYQLTGGGSDSSDIYVPGMPTEGWEDLLSNE